MKAKILKTKFRKEVPSKFGTLYSHEIHYDDKIAFYSSKKKEQTFFKEGQEAEFTEEERIYQKKDGSKGKFIVIKPERPQQRQSSYGKALTREQSRYSGFADSYTKDLMVAKILKPEIEAKDEEYNDIVMATFKKRGFEIFEHLVQLDKTLEL
jgi:hypothetical protein